MHPCKPQPEYFREKHELLTAVRAALRLYAKTKDPKFKQYAYDIGKHLKYIKQKYQDGWYFRYREELDRILQRPDQRIGE